MSSDRLLSPLEAAEKLGLVDRKGRPSAKSILYMKEVHQIPFVRIGTLVRFSDRALDRWIERRSRAKSHGLSIAGGGR